MKIASLLLRNVFMYTLWVLMYTAVATTVAIMIVMIIFMMIMAPTHVESVDAG